MRVFGIAVPSRCIVTLSVALSWAVTACNHANKSRDVRADGAESESVNRLSSHLASSAIALGATEYLPENYRAQLTPIAPGGSGAFTATAVHPKDPNFILAGTELNGVFRSTDGGGSWRNISKSLDSRQVSSIAIGYRSTTSAMHYAYLGTTDGVYVSSSTSLATLGDVWTLQTTGFERANCGGGACQTGRVHPVQSLAVDPSDARKVWAGIGGVMLGNDLNMYRSADIWKVYKSIDGGLTWQGVLQLNTRPENEATLGATVFSIEVDENYSRKVLVATDMGLYRTYNAGKTWYELGGMEVQLGETNPTLKTTTWSSCVSNGRCRTSYRGSGRCVEPAQVMNNGEIRGCLPTRPEVFESHTNLRGAKIVDRYIYVNVADSGWAGGIQGSLAVPEANCLASRPQLDSNGNPTGLTLLEGCLPNCNNSNNTSGAANDSTFQIYRGGVWRSRDGKRWTYIKPPTDYVRLRCSPDESLTKTTMYPFFDVNPSDDEHLVLGGSWPRGVATGFFDRRQGQWYRINDICNNNALASSALKNDCYEGNQHTGIWSEYGTSSPDVYGMLVAQWSPLKVYFGHIMGYWSITEDASYSPSGGSTLPPVRYDVQHLAQDQDQTDTDYWRSTGADLHCPHGGVEFLRSSTASSGYSMFVGAVDVGVLKSEDNGNYWKKVTEENTKLMDDARAINTDDHNGSMRNFIKLDNTRFLVADNNETDPALSVLYAPNDWNHVEGATGDAIGIVNYMLRATTPGDEADWSNIGGVFYDSGCNVLEPATTDGQYTCSGNGLPRSHVFLSGVLDPYANASRVEGSRRLMVGTRGNGIWIYDPLKVSPQWSQLTGTGCENLERSTTRVPEVWKVLSLADKGYPNHFLAAVGNSAAAGDGGNGTGSPNRRLDYEGIYLIKRANAATTPTYSCVQLVASANGHNRHENCNGASSCDFGGPVGLVNSSTGVNRVCECNPLMPNTLTVTNPTPNTLRILAGGKHRVYPVVYGTDISDTDILSMSTASLDWKIVLAFENMLNYLGTPQLYGAPQFGSAPQLYKLTYAGARWQAYIDGLPAATRSEWQDEYYELTNFKMKTFNGLGAVPGRPKLALALMGDAPVVERHATRHVYKTTDGGYDWKVATEFEDLPYKTLWRVDFSPDGSDVYLSGQCTSLYAAASPYQDTDGDGLSALIDPDPNDANQWYWIGDATANPTSIITSPQDRFVRGQIDGAQVITVEGVSDPTMASGSLGVIGAKIGIIVVAN
jgi:hypothetical protein